MIDLGFFGVVILFRMILDSFHDRDENTVAELKGSHRCNLLTGCQPSMDNNLIADHGAAFNLASVDSIAAVLVWRDDEYLIASGPFAQRTNRYGDDIKFGTNRNPDAY